MPMVPMLLAAVFRALKLDGWRDLMLTRKQHELLLLIHDRLQAEGIPPSFDEMKDALELKSKSGIHRLITALEERGFIRRLPNRARALEVIKLPDGYENQLASNPASRAGGKPASGFGVIEGGLANSGFADGTVTPFDAGKGRETRQGGMAARFAGGRAGPTAVPNAGQNNDGNGVSIAVMGRIAAGVPIAAIQEITRQVMVPPSMLGMGSHFALEVQGDSMIEAGILDGDLVVIKETSTAEAGDIVVALVDDEEATLKRFRKDKGNITLEAANPAYENRVLSADRVKVQGKLAGLVRKY
jgi:repressor LexA